MAVVKISHFILFKIQNSFLFFPFDVGRWMFDVQRSSFSLNLLDHIESMIESLMGHELVMGSGFDDAAFVENNNPIGIAGCGEPVRNHYGGSGLHEIDKGVLDFLLCFGIDVGSGFIQND